MVSEHDQLQSAKLRRRTDARTAMAGLTPEDRTAASTSICDQLKQLIVEHDPPAVLGFLPLSDEPDIRPVLQLLLDQQRTVAVPRILDAGHMEPARLLSLDVEHLDRDTHGVLTPKSLEPVAMDSIGLILIPGVAFDLDGGRLGRGGGYYDRFLSRIQHPVITVGCCFQCQIFSRIETGPQDVPVSKVLTEEPRSFV